MQAGEHHEHLCPIPPVTAAHSDRKKTRDCSHPISAALSSGHATGADGKRGDDGSWRLRIDNMHVGARQRSEMLARRPREGRRPRLNICRPPSALCVSSAHKSHRSTRPDWWSEPAPLVATGFPAEGLLPAQRGRGWSAADGATPPIFHMFHAVRAEGWQRCAPRARMERRIAVGFLVLSACMCVPVPVTAP